jgi:hypothetical protein
MTLDQLIESLSKLKAKARLGGNSVVHLLTTEAYIPITNAKVENDDDGSVIVLTVEKKRKSRNFPRTCIICNTKTVKQDIQDREMIFNINGNFHKVFIKSIPCEMCSSCNKTTFGTDSDKVIDAELKRLGFVR